LTMVLLVWGILEKQWYIEEIAALFLAMGLMLGAVAGLRPSRIARGFVTGAKDMVNVAFIIACGRALLIIAKDGQVLDTMLNAGVGLISALPLVVAAQMMFLVQSAINFFIHSGTAQAALTMPIMAPLADLLGLTRQTVVFAFQLCEFVNPILPTSAVTMGVLGVARVPWEKWARWFLPLMLILMALSLALLVPPVLLRWGPF
ncbi:MAG TPA: Na+/H+ antiporter NhaC family protein, partial [Acidobacteriota bacterium]|nr:Na+/H+ antiporter NhaC family protein [Acidobacteriota bacterium]